MSAYLELCAKARRFGWRVQLSAGGDPPRLDWLRVADREGEDVAFSYIGEGLSLDGAAAACVRDSDRWLSERQ